MSIFTSDVGRGHGCCVDAIGSAAVDVGPELLEVAAHQGVETLVARRVLHEARLVAETVAAVDAHAVEVRLVLPVAAVGVLAVLVEPGINTIRY